MSGLFSLLAFTSLITAPLAPNKRILWVELKGTVELGLSPYIVRALKEAEASNMDAVVLEIDTFGGRIDAAVVIRDALIDAKIPTIAWINKRAISAGALIALATRKIYFNRGSTMGAATPIQMGAEGAQSVENKVVSYFRAEMGSTAERNGRSRKFAEAMVSATEDIPGYVKKGDVLTLTDQTAETSKISDGLIGSREELFKKLEWEDPTVVEFKINWAESIVRFLTDPTVSSLLMSGGILGLFLEFQAPGFGLPGVFGITCLALYFFGKWIVDLAGFEEVIMMILGLILIFVEVFIFPGTFVSGVLGVIIIFVALLMSGISPHIPFDFSIPDIRVHLNSLAISILVAFAAMLFAMFYMSRNPRSSPLVMSETLDRGEGYSATFNHRDLMLKKGIVTADLRPTGKAEIEGKNFEVISHGDWLKAGTLIQVVEVEGMKIIVEKQKEILS